jgi:hypothetical protein
MSVVGGLFSDVFKSQGMVVPGSEGSIDWSKAGGNPADLNWAAIKPFEVIGPMSWAQTNKDATAPEEAKAKLDSIDSTDTRSEYQKWLDTTRVEAMGSDGAGNRKQEPGWYETTTPEQRAQFFQEHPMMAEVSRQGMELWRDRDPMGISSLQEKYSPGLLSGYLQETTGIAPSMLQNMVQQYSMYNNPAATGPGNSFETYAPSPNAGMSVADQYASYGAGSAPQSSGSDYGSGGAASSNEGMSNGSDGGYW